MADLTREAMRQDAQPHDADELRDAPVCPSCGHEERDAWEIDFGAGLDGGTTVACGACGKDFQCERVVFVSYRTKALDDEARRG